MGMYDDRVVLCGANSYNEKYYFDPDFSSLPKNVQDELKVMCVTFVNDVGGIFRLVFEKNGDLSFEVSTEDFDPTFDEIGSHLLVKRLQREKVELLEALETYYRVYFLNEGSEE